MAFRSYTVIFVCSADYFVWSVDGNYHAVPVSIFYYKSIPHFARSSEIFFHWPCLSHCNVYYSFLFHFNFYATDFEYELFSLDITS